MMKNYRFKVKVNSDKEGDYYLNIKPFFRRNRQYNKGMYPIDFSELNVPLFMSKSKSYFGGDDVNYFLDFENSFDGNGKPYGEAYFKRDGQRKILGELEKHLDPIIVKFLKGDIDLLKRVERVGFESDGGLDIKNSKARYGRPKFGRKAVTPINSKKVSD